VYEPTPPNFSPLRPQGQFSADTLTRLSWLILVLEIALGLRVLAAGFIELHIQRRGANQLCLFPDTQYYWELGRMIRSAAVTQIIEWSDIPHFALRTPGYPLFLAACHTVFGERTLPIRLVQAVLGTISVYLVYCLTRQFTIGASSHDKDVTHNWVIPIVAALIAAVGPNYVAMSPLILSEEVFEPLLLAALLGLAVLWPKPRIQGQGKPVEQKAGLIALGSGMAAGAAILVRPSWALFVPMMLTIWVLQTLGTPFLRGTAIRSALVYILGVVGVMTPWWYRNARIYNRLVPTALWMGASLYDGIKPGTTGASDMSFLADREIWPLDEQDQDAELIRRALTFARMQPRQCVELALKKLARYWSLWPTSENLQSVLVKIVCAVGEVPFLGLLALGAWIRRRELRTLLLLACPVLYFCVLHLVFASSMRYRIPAQMPAIGLAAIGCVTLCTSAKAYIKPS
jgi:4-amino-4-deoxy-L-arabinose transferase-like glycosyltransferase